MKEIKAENFNKEVLQSKRLVLVEFYAKWNGACHLNSQVIKEVTTQLSDRLEVFRLNFNEYPGVAKTYGVNQVPAIVIFSKGRVIDNLQGLSTKSILHQKILTALHNQ